MLVVAVDRNRNGLPVGDLFGPQVAEADYELAPAGLRAAQMEDRAVDAVLFEALLAFHLECFGRLDERHQHQIRRNHGLAERLQLHALADREPQLVDVLCALVLDVPDSRLATRWRRAALCPTP